MTPLVWKALLGGVIAVLGLQASALDIEGVLPAALDQPQINAAITLPGSSTPLADGGTGTFNIQAFFDTGASGVLIAKETRDVIGLPIQSDVFFGDVGVGGEETFAVSSEVDIYLATFPSLDVNDPVTFQTVYDQKFTNIRMQGGLVPSPFPLPPLDVFGMPLFQDKTVVMDARPVNNITGNMETSVYNSLAHPNVPDADRTVQMSYGNFARFTRTYELNGNTETPLDPDQFGPTFSNNPFIGPDPVATFENGGTPPSGSPAPIAIEHNGLSTTGSFLFDTGAAASIISEVKAAELGITYAPDDGDPLTPPQLLQDGQAVANQFTLTIGGVGGSAEVAGIFFDEMTLPTVEGDPIRYVAAPLLVADITLQDPVTAEELTLDGVFGMNYLVGSALVAGGFPVDLAAGAFDFLVFDEASGTLGLTFDPDVVTILDGDYDNNGLVGQGDLDLVLQYWGDGVTNGESIDPTWINSAGVTAPLIGQDELAIVLQNWGNETAITNELNAIIAATGLNENQVFALIPEPNTLTLVVGVFALWMLRSRATLRPRGSEADRPNPLH